MWIAQKIVDVASGVKAVITVLPQLQPIFESLKEKRFSRVFRSVKETLLSKCTHPGLMSTHVMPYFASIQQEGSPFVQFDGEPEQISQIKKIINALDHVVKGLEIIETYPDSISFGALIAHPSKATELLNRIAPHAYELVDLLTQFDIDITEYFSVEVQQLLSFLQLFKTFATSQMTRLMDGSALGNTQRFFDMLGHRGGILVDQLQSHTGETDLQYLTQFSGVLPGHLADLSAKIRRHAAVTCTPAPQLTAAEVSQLTICADDLLQTLTKIKMGGVLDSLNIKAYIRICGDISTLSKHILEQIKQVNIGIGEAILQKLSTLKYQHLLQLFCLVDKIELHGALNPGALSTPLMTYLRKWYVLIVHHAGSVVDVRTRRPDLLVIENSNFLHARMEQLLSRVAALTTKQLGIENAREALQAFYVRINEYQAGYHQGFSVLHSSTKRELLQLYQFIHPVMVQKSSDLDFLIRFHLEVPGSELFGEQPELAFSACLDIKDALIQKIDKSHASQQFYRILTEDLIQSVFLQADTLVLPYSFDWKNPFSVDESVILADVASLQPKDKRWKHEQTHVLLQDNTVIVGEIARSLHEAYQVYLHKLESVNAACLMFKQKLSSEELSHHKEQLRRLYLMIQPYLMNVTLEDNEQEILTRQQRLEVEQSLLQCLRDEHETITADWATLDIVAEWLDRTILALHHHRHWALSRGKHFTEPTRLYLKQQVLDSTVSLDVASTRRLHHVFKSESYSQAIHQLSEAVDQTFTVLSLPVREILQRQQESGVPFPDIENEVGLLNTCDQVLWLKRLKNCIYYLETYYLSMEALNSQSYSAVYVWNVIKAYWSAYLSATLFLSLKNDSNGFILLQDGLERLKQLQSFGRVLQPLYSTPSTAVGEPTQATQYNGIWYPMLTFMVLPEHLSALFAARGFSPLDAQTQQNLAKKMTLDIEKIIRYSDSYFRLYLVSPEMVDVFNTLKAKLSQFSGTTVDSVLSHLQYIREEVMAELLLKTDAWEQRLNLAPGKISEPVEDLLKKFFINLIEPLELPSEKHLLLVTSLVYYQSRRRQLERGIGLAQAEWFRLNPLVDKLAGFVDLISQWGSKEGTVEERAALQQSLHAILPILVQHQHRFSLGINKQDADLLLDSICHELIPNARQHFKHIKFLAIRCLAAYRGRQLTQFVKRRVIERQLSALNRAEGVHGAQNTQYEIDYATQLFQRQLAQLVTFQTDIEYLKLSYCSTLEAFLLQRQAGIVKQLLSQPPYRNLQEKVVRLLSHPLQLFFKEHYTDFAQLENIAGAIADFRRYLSLEMQKLRSGPLLFESQKTLHTKRLLLSRMEAMLMDGEITATQRLIQIQTLISQPETKNQLMDYHRYNRVSFAGLKQIVLYLLQMIGLYTPPYEQRFRALEQSVKTDSPRVDQFMQCHARLFATRSRIYELPKAPLQPADAVLALSSPI
jgi:hypothetical protein